MHNFHMMHMDEVLKQASALPWRVIPSQVPEEPGSSYLSKLEKKIPSKTSITHFFIYYFPVLVRLFSQHIIVKSNRDSLLFDIFTEKIGN